MMLSVEHCRSRQQRVRQTLQELSVERAVFVGHENIQYLTGFRTHHLMRAAVSLDVDGDCVLSAPNREPDHHAADRVVTFDAQWCATLRQEQIQSALTSLGDAVPSVASNHTAVEFSLCGPHLRRLLTDSSDDLADIDVAMWQLRRRKYPDELAMIRRAIDCTEAMYDAARQIIEPGISELDVFNHLHSAAVQVAGEPLTGFGNDFQCNSPGGPPRDRRAEPGELYILDLGPGYRGYFADNCRTIAVGGSPTDQQMAAWEAILAVLDLVEQSVRPGVSAADLYQQAKGMLDAFRPDAFFHHLGHGFGLFPHEAPHLNPNWNDTFEEGDVFTAEPGLYTEALRAGIRLEQNYLVTADGVERLTNFTLEL